MSRSIDLTDLHHVSRTTRKLDDALKFYCQVLGFKPLTRPPFSFRGAWLFAAGIQIHLIESETAPVNPPEIDSRRNHIAFRVADVNQVIEILTEHQIPFLERTNAGGVRQIFVHDPDGHQIELAATTPSHQGYVPAKESE